MKDQIDDMLSDTIKEICARADRAQRDGERHAFLALNDDEPARRAAHDCRGQITAYMDTVKLLDALRVKIQQPL